MRAEGSPEGELVHQDRLDALWDRLDASEEKHGRLYAQLRDARERAARLEEEGRRLDECLSEAREHNAVLMEENRLLRQRASEAPEPHRSRGEQRAPAGGTVVGRLDVARGPRPAVMHR